MRTRVFATLLAFALLALPAAAQEQTGSITGTVKDSSGAVLPGVTVEARSPAAVGVSSAVTDANGIYRFPALPPGTYEVTASLQGFVPAKVSDALVTLGKELKIELALRLAGVAETVNVTAGSPLIDVKQNATFSTIDREAIDRIPKGRDFTTILKTTAGAQAESKAGGTQIDGASGSENRFIIDGMDTTNLQDGTSGKTMLLDFVQEVQVKSSGYNAEFGGATGGVISVVTKTGSNSFHGSGGTWYNNDGMQGAIRPGVRFNPQHTSVAETGLITPDDQWTYWSPMGDIGGPIMHDKLWFYGGMNYSRDDMGRDAIFYTDPSKTNRHFTWWDSQKYLNYNVSTQLSNKLRLKFSASNQRNGARRTAPGLQPNNTLALDPSAIYPNGVASAGMTTGTFDKNADGSINQAAFDNRYTNTGTNSQNDTYVGNADWIITPKFFVNAQAGMFYTNSTTPPEFRGDQVVHAFSGANNDSVMTAAGYPTVPAQFQQVNGFTDNKSSAGTVRNIYTRDFINANATYYHSMKGQHTFKAGMRFERFGNDALIGNALPRVNVFWGQTYTNPDTAQTLTGKYGYYELEQPGTIGAVHSNNYAFWVQDGWEVNNKLTLNLGVRTENEHIPSFKDPAQFPDALSITFGFMDKLAPRLGFAYDVKGDGRWKAYGSYGWFYTITPLELPRGSFGGDHWVQYFWTLDDPDYSKIQCGEGTSGCPGTYIGPGNGYDLRHSSNQTDPLFEAYFNRPGMTGIDPNLKPVKTGEFTTGVDHELNRSMSLGIRYVHKWMFRTIEDTGIYVSGTEDYLIANPGEGLAVNMEPLYPNFPTPKPKRNYDALEFRLNKRFANHWSGQASYTYSRLYGNYGGLASSDENGRTSPNVNRYYDNTVESYGSNGQAVYGLLATDRPSTFKLSGGYDFKWGTTLGANWFIESGTPQTTVLRFTGYPVFINGRDDLGRTPALSQLDLNLMQEIKLPGHTRLQLGANIDNVFDQDTWLAYWPASGYGPTPYITNTGGQGSVTLQFPPAQLYQQGGYNVQQIVSNFIAGGGNLKANPLYTTPASFQGRRLIRFQVKYTF